MNKKVKKKTVIMLLIVLIILIIVVNMYLILRNNNKDKSSTIIATKIITGEDENVKRIKYKIEIQNYNIENVEKEITFETKEQAQLEYERYKTINEYERKNLNVQVKNKKLTILMTEEQFKEDIEYDEESNITMVSESGQIKKIINQSKVINILNEQGYTIK